MPFWMERDLWLERAFAVLADGIARCLTEPLDNGLFRVRQLDTVSALIRPVALQFCFNLLVPGTLVLPLPFSQMRIGEHQDPWGVTATGRLRCGKLA